MSLPGARAAALLLLSLYGFSTFAASLQSNIPNLLNVSSSHGVSLPTLGDPSNNDEYGDCFNPATPRRGLYPAKEQDCLNAAKELYNLRDPFRPITFARRNNVGFRLPKVVRSGTCVISIDVMRDSDKDFFKPWLVYITARDIAHRCTQGAFRFGGRNVTGPKEVVDVLVFGRIWPIEKGAIEPTISESATVVARERLASDDSISLNETLLGLTGPLVTKTTSLDENLSLNAPELGGDLECFDPPLPRERAWPINITDCDMATEAIFGDRDRDQKYTFSRDPVSTKFYFHLPLTFRYRSCVVHLDMNKNSDQDTVRLSIVKATAWILAHKCSGEERSVDQYGGRGTVGVGAKNLINVWVYARMWPPPGGTTNVTSLLLPQPAPLIGSE
ncbi:MAG: hypothetical protein ASARMPREDX12_009455 [Alectoria sarmentosa]|nr:MAG: hypothetical protein ASARMPREDX12_000788 [Alectoria sarmentosa]CAD6580103.1 MAG: hypothetical protein ASARMPREDX12_009455 [Alectoria sarmentosa]